jgi:hypothetical protein
LAALVALGDANNAKHSSIVVVLVLVEGFDTKTALEQGVKRIVWNFPQTGDFIEPDAWELAVKVGDIKSVYEAGVVEAVEQVRIKPFRFQSGEKLFPAKRKGAAFFASEGAFVKAKPQCGGDVRQVFVGDHLISPRWARFIPRQPELLHKRRLLSTKSDNNRIFGRNNLNFDSNFLYPIEENSP